MGFFSNFFSGLKLPEYIPYTSGEGVLYILDYIKYQYYFGRMYRSGHYEIGGGECKYHDDVFRNAIKYSRELLECSLNGIPRNMVSGEWKVKTSDDDFYSKKLFCEFYNIRPYFDLNGIAHYKIGIFKVLVLPSTYDSLISSPLGSPRSQNIVLRLEYLEKREWDATISRFSYFCSKNSDFLGKPETISDFSIQNCNNSNVFKEWIYAKATPCIWEKAESIKFAVSR